jgi:hypothetical protein
MCPNLFIVDAPIRGDSPLQRCPSVDAVVSLVRLDLALPTLDARARGVLISAQRECILDYVQRVCAMRCPKCNAQVASFWRWFFWPGPTRHCLNCAAKLRYVGFYLQLAAHVVLGGTLGIVFSVVSMAIGAPVWLSLLIVAVVLTFTAVLLPWRFGRYEEIAD